MLLFMLNFQNPVCISYTLYLCLEDKYSVNVIYRNTIQKLYLVDKNILHCFGFQFYINWVHSAKNPDFQSHMATCQVSMATSVLWSSMRTCLEIYRTCHLSPSGPSSSLGAWPQRAWERQGLLSLEAPGPGIQPRSCAQLATAVVSGVRGSLVYPHIATFLISKL